MLLTEAAHGTVARHYRRHEAGEEPSTNPVATVFAWTRALAHRGRLDATPGVVAFAKLVERAVLRTVESGRMTRDLAMLMDGGHEHLGTEAFVDAVVAEVAADLAAGAAPLSREGRAVPIPRRDGSGEGRGRGQPVVPASGRNALGEPEHLLRVLRHRLPRRVNRADRLGDGQVLGGRHVQPAGLTQVWNRNSPTLPSMTASISLSGAEPASSSSCSPVHGAFPCRPTPGPRQHSVSYVTRFEVDQWID